MRGANVCHDKRLFGNPEKSGHPRKLDIPKPFLFTDPTPPHRCSLVAFNRKRAPICLPLAINIALITLSPKYAEFKIVNNFAYKGSTSKEVEKRRQPVQGASKSSFCCGQLELIPTETLGRPQSSLKPGFRKLGIQSKQNSCLIC